LDYFALLELDQTYRPRVLDELETIVDEFPVSRLAERHRLIDSLQAVNLPEQDFLLLPEVANSTVQFLG